MKALAILPLAFVFLACSDDDRPATKTAAATSKTTQAKNVAKAKNAQAKAKIKEAAEATGESLAAWTDDAKLHFQNWSRDVEIDFDRLRADVDKQAGLAKNKLQTQLDGLKKEREEVAQRFDDYRKSGENDRQAAKKKFVESFNAFKNSLKNFKNSVAHPAAQ